MEFGYLKSCKTPCKKRAGMLKFPLFVYKILYKSKNYLFKFHIQIFLAKIVD